MELLSVEIHEEAALFFLKNTIALFCVIDNHPSKLDGLTATSERIGLRDVMDDSCSSTRKELSL